MRKKAMSATLLAVVVTAVALLAVPSSTVAQDPVDFEKDVFPILIDKCLVCHGPVDSFGELRLDSKERILKGGDMGEIVVPGEPDKSPMFVRTSLPADDLDIMPAEGDPLTPEQLDVIKRWIAAGAEFGDWVGF